MKSSTCRSLKLIVSCSPLTLLLGINSLDANHPETSRRPHPRSPLLDRPVASRRLPAPHIVGEGGSAAYEGPVRAWRASAGAGGGSVPASGPADTSRTGAKVPLCMESSGLRSVAVTVMERLPRRSTGVSTRRLIVLVCAVAMLLVGCGSGSSSRQASAPSTSPSPAAVAPTPQDPSGLYGKSFKATSASENGNPRTLLSSYPISISFGKHGRGVFFSASCNDEGAKNAHVTAERVVVAPHSVWSTLVGCEPKSSEQGRWFDAFLFAIPHWQLAGRSLTLTNGTATVTFVPLEPARQ